MRNLVSFTGAAAPSRTAPLSMALALAASITAQSASAATVSLETEAFNLLGNDNVISLIDPLTITSNASILGSTFVLGGASDDIISDLSSPLKVFDDNDQYGIARAVEAHNRYLGRVQSTLTTSREEAANANADNLVYAVIEPLGVHSDQAPLTFTHIAGSVGLVSELLPTGKKRYLSAHTGIDVSEYQVTQTGPDPAGIRELGQTYTVGDESGTRASPNARAQAMFTTDSQGVTGIEELQITVGFDMRNEDGVQDIALKTISEDGAVHTIDADKFQVVETPDFLVLVIRDAPQELAAIYQNMLAGGDFEVKAVSTRNAEVANIDFSFGDTFAQDIQAGYKTLNNPQHYFTMSQEFKRRVAYSLDAPEVDHKISECIFLGLNEMNEEQLEGVRVIMGEVTDGTSMLPRNFEALIALDADNNLIAAGSQAWWGVNYETNVVRRSGSSETRFTENGGNVFSGCTTDLVTPIVPRDPILPGQPGVPVNDNPNDRRDPLDPDDKRDPCLICGTTIITKDPEDTPSQVGILDTGTLLLSALLLLDGTFNRFRATQATARTGASLSRSAVQQAGSLSGSALNMARSIVGRREEEFEPDEFNAA